MLQLPPGEAKGMTRMHHRVLARLSNSQVVCSDTAYGDFIRELEAAAEDGNHLYRGYLAALGMTPSVCRELALALRQPPQG
jgi:hypothetical protein